jgi:hypothetical protein
VHDLALIRRLCGDISKETDLKKVDELVALLQAVIRDDLEDMRTRMAFLRRKYAIIFDESKAAD